MIILAAATAGYTYIFKLIVDTIGGLDTISAVDSRVATFVKIVAPVVIGVTAVSGAALFAQTLLSNSVALTVVGRLQSQMFAALQRADFARFQQDATGHLVSHFTNDVNLISQALLRTLGNVFRDLLSIIFMIAIMIYYDWMITGLLLLVYPVAIFPIIKISRRIRGTSHAAQAHMGKMTAQLQENLSGARMVRTYGLEDQEIRRLNTTFDERIRLYQSLVTTKAWVDPIFTCLGGIAIAGVLTFGVWRVATGASTYGDLVAILGAVGLIAAPIRALGTLNNVVQEGLVALTRIYSVIDETPHITDTAEAIIMTDAQGHITFYDVGFSYSDGTQALDRISLDVKPGETVACVGPSGGGKSSLINLIPRLYDVSTGQITLDGTDIRQLTLSSLRKQVAVVSQNVTLFNESIAKNISFGDPMATRADIIDAAKAADAHDFILRLPDGYNTVIGENGETLSGGQRQRLSIARAILRDAPILLLDEATSALDAQSETKVRQALERLSNGRTTFIVAHNLSSLHNVDRIYVLENGKIIETGTPKTLIKKKGGLFAKLRHLQ